MNILEDIASLVMFIFVVGLIFYCLHGENSEINKISPRKRKARKEYDNPLVIGKDVSLRGRKLR